MSLKEKIEKDLVGALKKKETVRLGTLRLLSAALHNQEIAKRSSGKEPVLSDEEVLGVIQREAKKRKEAIELFTKGNRADLASGETSELSILEEYLPVPLSEEEIKAAIKQAIQTIQPQSEKDFGRVMGEVMKQVKGRAESALISKLVKESLAEKLNEAS